MDLKKFVLECLHALIKSKQTEWQGHRIGPSCNEFSLSYTILISANLDLQTLYISVSQTLRQE
jgi:hypothetical protein